jgi:hypothetical protein
MKIEEIRKVINKPIEAGFERLFIATTRELNENEGNLFGLIREMINEKELN